MTKKEIASELRKQKIGQYRSYNTITLIFKLIENIAEYGRYGMREFLYRNLVICYEVASRYYFDNFYQDETCTLSVFTFRRAVLRERVRQNRLHESMIRPSMEWVMLILRECMEIESAYTNRIFTSKHGVYNECVQTAALIIRYLEEVYK